MTSTSTPPPQQAAVVATPPAPAAPPAAPATTATTTTTTTTTASTAPAPAATNTSPASMRSTTSTPATKRRPYEDPTDGERYQLYTHSRAHPELKQKDLVSWFATKFGKEINQSTVSRALKRYRDNPPGDPEQEGRARSKRGGGAGATGAGQAKRRRTGGHSAPAGGAALAEATETGSGGVEEEAARADEQVQRENQQGIIGRGRPDGIKTDAADESHVSTTAQTLPYARQHHHHHHSIPPQTGAPLVHAIPQIPLAPGQHITAQGFTATGHHQISQPAPMANMSSHHTQPHHIQHAPLLTQDIDSDSDSDIPDAPVPSFINQPTQTDDSKEIQLAQITKQWEVLLLRSCLETNPTAARIQPTTNGISASESSAGEQTGILSREALITYLVGRNDLIRNLQERVATLEKDNARLKRKNAQKSAVITKLTAPSTEGVRP